MRLLLDTHVWVWQLAAPQRLSRAARTALTDSTNELFLSPMSVWETLLLARRGRLALEPNPKAWVRDALRLSATTMAEINHDVAICSEDLAGLPSRDPVDRFLAATAVVGGLTLVTADGALRRWKGVETLW